MDTLQMLGVALGLATLAGINLYLTVFLSGLAINLGWIQLAPQYEKLAILADPAILTVSGILFAIEFFADKIPWLDSVWDSIHTLIRPVGGALLSLQVLGTSNPVFDVIVALLGGSVTLGAHGIKAGSRLLVNASPEPFSNVALSVTEDVAVVGGLALTAANPVVMFFLVICLIVTAIWLAPRIFGFFAVRLRFIWNKIAGPAESALPELARKLPPDADIRLAEAAKKSLMPLPEVAWCLRGFAERLPGLNKNTEGHLVGLASGPHAIVFVPKSRRLPPTFLDLDEYKLCQKSSLLAERLIVYSLTKKPRYTFSFFRWQAPHVSEALARINHTIRSLDTSRSQADVGDESRFAPSPVPSGLDQ